jgi:RHS repeat-associated protein
MTEHIIFYGAQGEKLGVFWLTCTYGPCTFGQQTSNVWFAGKMIWESMAYQTSMSGPVTQDRLGTNRFAGARFYPYGEEITSTASDRTKFGTYNRDSYTGFDYAQNRYFASTYGRFVTPDPFGGSESPVDPGSWNRYAYAVDDPVNRNDPNGLCPPGYVPATADQMQGIVDTAESYILPGSQALTHSDGTHYSDSGGVLTAIDCTGLIAQALAGIAYSATNFQEASKKDQFATGQIPNLFSAAAGWQVGEIISFGSHAGIVTGVSSTGQVTSFVGSQTSSGPAVVNIANSPYWAKRLGTAKAYTPCVPAGTQQQASNGGGGGSVWGGGGLQPIVDSFLSWVESIPLGGGGGGRGSGEEVTESISYDF